VTDSLLSLLQDKPEGVLPLNVARGILGLTGPATIIEKIARDALLSLPHAEIGIDGRVRLAPDRSTRGPVALVLRSTGPYPPQDILLELGVAAINDEAITAVHGELVRPDRPLPPDAVRAAGVDPFSLEAGRAPSEVIGRVAPIIENSILITFSGRAEFDFLRRLLSIMGREESPAGHLALAPALRRAGAMPPRGDLLEAASTLRVYRPETCGAGDFARVLAQVYLAALERGIDLTPPRRREQFDFGRTKFGPDLLRELPERPGVYRFLNRSGKVLYVGKSKDLRTRVSGYFGHREKRRRGHRELMEQVADLQYEETGSDLAALLRETELIREHATPFNVQRAIKRRRPRGGDLVLFLPGAGKDEVELLFVRAGAPAGRARSDRKARGMREIRGALARIYFSPEPIDPGNEADAQIITTWLRARRDARNFVDLSEVAGRNDAALRIREYLTDPDLFRVKIFRR